MENRRFILIALLGVVLFFLYQAWQQDYVRKQATVAEQQAPLPDVDQPPSLSPEMNAVALPGAPAPAAAKGGRVRVLTDRVAVEIALDGGELRRVELIGYPLSKKAPEKSLALLDDRDGHYFVLQSGLIGNANKALAANQTVFTAPAGEFKLADGVDTLEVPLEYTDASGYSVRKLYRFQRGSYEIELVQQLSNRSGAELDATPYARFVRTAVPAGDEPPFVQTFLGVGLYEQKDETQTYRFKKVAFKKLEKEAFETTQTGGWIAMLQHYFAAAILPPVDQTATYSAKPGKDRGYLAQYIGATSKVADQATQDFTTRLYIGPKLQEIVASVAPGFELTVDYGFLTSISQPLFWVLAKLHKLTGNWGWAIVLLTLLVKAVMYKLSEAQYRSMAKMRKFAPRITELKERYSGDRERMSKAMMELYKKEGFNPLAGCWPLLVQMPVFFALYWVFLESVELRQADFALWITDLTSPDPFYVLPVLYGFSMWVMQKLSGQTATMDPMQQKIMNVMPIALTAFFTFFPAGLVLYWLVSNLVSIAQQWYITRKLDREGLSTKPVKA